MTTDFVRGNLKKVLLLLMLTFCAAGVYAQSSMSDSQVMEYIAKEYQKGTSQRHRLSPNSCKMVYKYHRYGASATSISA